MSWTAARETSLRRHVIATALEMSRTGLSPGRSGNVSTRLGNGMLITPSGQAYDTLKPADIVFVDADGTCPKGGLKPSSEWRFHLEVYRTRPDCAAIVHTHSLHATALACAHKSIPPFHYMVAIAGGDDIPVVPYAPFGTEELAAHVAKGLRARDACLMANHGQIAIGRDTGAQAGPGADGAALTDALERAAEVETLAAQFIAVLGLGQPKLLSKPQMRDVLERFAGYGQNAQTAATAPAQKPAVRNAQAAPNARTASKRGASNASESRTASNASESRTATNASESRTATNVSKSRSK